jgi:hypothetical protein
MEAALAVVIVAFGFLSTMELFSACTAESRRAAQVTTAQMLTTSIHELSQGLAFKDPFYAQTTFGVEPGESQANPLSLNDLDDFDGFSASPPIDATRTVRPELSQYRQIVTVMPIDPDRPGNNTDEKNPQITKNPYQYTGGLRMRVTIEYRRTPSDPPTTVLQSAWVRLDE